MYAVVKTGGKQYRVEEGGELVVQKLDAAIGDTVDFDVLFFADGAKVVSDPASVGSASVTAEVVEQFKDDKVIVFKFKKRKGYRRTRGHRQDLTRVRVTKIAAPTGAKKASKAEEPASVKAAAATSTEKRAQAPEPAPRSEKQPAAGAEPGQCEAVTGSGDRCKNKAKDGSKYCGVHAKKYGG